MAKGNMFLGMSRGSVGDVTFYRGRGQQLARARNRAPKNPRSSAQIIQRMILATASKAYSRLKGICDHSFQGVTYGGESQSYFLKRAMEDIRNWVALTYPDLPDSARDPRLYVGLAEPTSPLYSGIGLLVSQGSIPSVPVSLNTPSEGADPVVDHFGALVSSGADITAVLTALGAVPGDQLTVLGFANDASHSFAVSRYVVRADASSTELAEEWDGSIDLAAFDAEKSLLDERLSIDATGGKIMPKWNVSGMSLEAGCIIISRKVGTVWERSTQRLVWLLDAGDYALTDNVIGVWEAGTAEISVDNPYYLNNADD